MPSCGSDQEQPSIGQAADRVCSRISTSLHMPDSLILMTQCRVSTCMLGLALQGRGDQQLCCTSVPFPALTGDGVIWVDDTRKGLIDIGVGAIAAIPIGARPAVARSLDPTETWHAQCHGFSWLALPCSWDVHARQQPNCAEVTACTLVAALFIHVVNSWKSMPGWRLTSFLFPIYTDNITRARQCASVTSYSRHGCHRALCFACQPTHRRSRHCLDAEQ